ncbi:nck-associated protein 1-like [Physella acuta]|uniref:nck-associated protein 1-like n=1 Tax=Physella acuta TaxID=109671 RepID=UPI0027DB9320|nr:nck-associated protein 1-like [Physella acuta]
MAQSINISQQKLAEKLTILNDRGIGMLTRIYNIKKMLGTPELKPDILKDKALNPVIEKVLLKKFPLYDTKASQLSVVNEMKNAIVNSLSVFYNTFVDVLMLKDHIVELLTTIDACQVHFDITLNYDLTKNYLDLITTYVSIMILIMQIDDRKSVLALYNSAHEFVHEKSDQSYHRLGQMCIDYDIPMKKLAEEFIPHGKHMVTALLSLKKVYPLRNKTADELRALSFLAILADPTKMGTIPLTDTYQCDYLSLERIEKWIIFGFMLCYQGLAEPDIADLWKSAFQAGFVVTLFRNETLQIHSFAISFLESIKGQNKRVAELKEYQTYALQKSSVVHRDRRKFLRITMRDLTLVFREQPGLLGPKALYVFQALSLARDEVLWLIRHSENLQPKKYNVKVSADDFSDRQLPELLFYIEDLRGLLKKHRKIVRNYFTQYLSGYDALQLAHLLQSIYIPPNDDTATLSSLQKYLSEIPTLENPSEPFDFKGFRLDWFRLQARTSVSKAGLELRSHEEIAKHMNTICFHTKMVDLLDETLDETGDLSIYCFYCTLFEQHFKQCIDFLAQHRFTIIFPLLCSHFMNATHPLCPEERIAIGKTSLKYAHWLLKEISEELSQVIIHLCDSMAELECKLLPCNSAAILHYLRMKAKEKKEKKDKLQEPEKPGVESFRKNRENFTQIDKFNMALTDLCYALDYSAVIDVWDHGFIPREFFQQSLESNFNKALIKLIKYNPDTTEITRPSELLFSVRAYMNVIQNIGNYVHVDITRVFKNVLYMHSQPYDCNGEKTVTYNYTQWYIEVLLKRVICSTGHVVYSPNRKTFVTVSAGEHILMSPEEYADPSELRALSELIGPCGMKYLGERLMQAVANHVDELKKMVRAKNDILVQLRTNLDKPDLVNQLTIKLLAPSKNAPSDAEALLTKMIRIGLIMAFRNLAQEALNDVLEQRIPFLMSSIRDIQHNVLNKKESEVLNELASTAGEKCKVDPTLCHALYGFKSENATESDIITSSDDEYRIACLLFVFVAVSIPKLARMELSTFRASIEGHLNNSHCLAKSVNSLAGALFSLYGPGDASLRLQEFLSLAASNLLRLAIENDKESLKNRESVYLILDQIVQESPFLTMDVLETCFPYALLRNAYHSVYKASATDII